MERMKWTTDVDAVMAPPASPYVDQMQQYVDIERQLEQERQSIQEREAKVRALSQELNSLRGKLVAYLDGDRAAVSPEAVTR